MKLCKDCASPDLAKRREGFRNRCVPCYNLYQRDRYQKTRPRKIENRKELYAKHAVKRRAESKANKLKNREKYTLLEWFRKRGISAKDIPANALASLTKMKQAVNESKNATQKASQ